MSHAPLPLRPAAVVFDVEGVIAHPDGAALAAGLKEIHPAWTPALLSELRHGPALYPLWEAYSVGRLDGDRYWGAVLEAWPEHLAAGSLGKLRRLMAEATWAQLDERVLATAERLREQGLATALLSNSCEDYEAQIRRFEQRFDLVHFSHRTGRRKPQAAAYTALAEALVLPPESLLFIDDKDRNLRAAAALGIMTHHFDGAEGLERRLLALGLLP